MIGAAVALLRSYLTLRRFVSLLLMLRRLLMLLLCRPRLLMLLSLLRFYLLPTLFLVLSIGTDSGSEKQEQNCGADNAGSFH